MCFLYTALNFLSILDSEGYIYIYILDFLSGICAVLFVSDLPVYYSVIQLTAMSDV